MIASTKHEGPASKALHRPAHVFFDDGPGKPVGINKVIGRRPIFAAGNSDGDYEMLREVTSGPGPRFVSSSTRPTPIANGPMTASRISASSIRR